MNFLPVRSQDWKTSPTSVSSRRLDPASPLARSPRNRGAGFSFSRKNNESTSLPTTRGGFRGHSLTISRSVAKSSGKRVSTSRGTLLGESFRINAFSRLAVKPSPTPEPTGERYSDLIRLLERIFPSGIVMSPSLCSRQSTSTERLAHSVTALLEIATTQPIDWHSTGVGDSGASEVQPGRWCESCHFTKTKSLIFTQWECRRPVEAEMYVECRRRVDLLESVWLKPPSSDSSACTPPCS